MANRDLNPQLADSRVIGRAMAAGGSMNSFDGADQTLIWLSVR